jgi:RNase P/RNase MRP subunit POP5
VSVTDLVCHGVLQEALRSLLGSVGSAKVGLQLLDWDVERARGIVATNGDMSVGARAAFMLMGSYQGQTCRIDVLQQSLFLSALAT